ncbi:hypothetical protein C8R46DRAFT_1300255 [Mycena filopes]|nr:hypothetical protein C8R46DRAFT_1300255 [Mycena filopes]
MDLGIIQPFPVSHPWPTIRTLELGYCFPSNARDLWAFLALEHLTCSGWHSSIYAPGPGSDILVEGPPLRIKRLALTSSTRYSLPYIAPQLAACSGLKVDTFVVTFAAEAHRNAGPCSALLARIGPTLRELCVVDVQEATDAAPNLDITACTALRHLSLELPLPHTMRLLRQVSVSAAAALLTSVTLNVGPSAATGDENEKWEDVDVLLGGYAFRALERVVIRVVIATRKDGGEAARERFVEVEARMGRLGARGLLRFEVGEVGGAGV